MTLSYDPLLRIYQVSAGTTTSRFAYDGANAIAEYDGSNALQQRTVFGPGVDEPSFASPCSSVPRTDCARAIVQYDASGTRSWLTADERGSIVALADDSGNVTAINTYDEYGKPGASNSGRFQYTGQMWVPDAKAFNYKARFYSPHLGRFLQPDPIGYDAGPNVYEGMGSDPVNRSDPLGLQSCADENKDPKSNNSGTDSAITVTVHSIP